MSVTGHHPHILIVDDVPHNIQIVASMLHQQDYRLSFALSGQIALSLIGKQKFDLILLDIQMPEMDGFQVCEILKAKEQTREIPVIFLTANVGPELTVRGFELGAVDYITKPVEATELRARVETHLALKQARDQVLSQNQSLQELNQDKSRLLEIVSHDLRSPLTVLVSGLEYFKRHLTQNEPGLLRRLQNMETATARMENIIQHSLNHESIQQGQTQLNISSFVLEDSIQTILGHYQDWFRLKEIQIHVDIPSELTLNTDRTALEQILDNLLSNALKFSPKGRQIWLQAENGPQNHILIEIRDEGPGFTESDLAHMFTSQGRLSASPTSGESSLGLGLSIVKKLLELLQGQIKCTSIPGTGACFELQIPRDLSSNDLEEHSHA